MTDYVPFIGGCWGAFLLIWLAFAMRRDTGRTTRAPGSVAQRVAAAIAFVVGLVLAQNLHVLPAALPDRVAVAGCALCVGGLAFATWARFALGGSWGMPMTLHENPVLVTAGPYRYVRHPIYTGMSAMVIGSALAFPGMLLWAAVMLVYMLVSARREERDMALRFPDAYPAYRQRSKMLVPFVL